MEIGILAPHFGEHASVENLMSLARKAEAYGFDSVWARDSLLYRPLIVSQRDWTFIDPFVVLSFLGSNTDELTLGTGVASLYRHPVHLARLYSSISFVGQSRVIAGLGLGGTKAELELTSVPYDDRPAVHRETVSILRELWSGDEVSFSGEHYSFEEARIQPPPSDSIPIWGGGSSPAAVRRAAAYCDGWLPGRITLKSFEAALKLLREKAKEHDRAPPSTGAIPVVSVDDDADTAEALVDAEKLLEEANNRHTYWIRPSSGRFATIDHLEGALIVGTPDDVVEAVEAYEDLGLDHLVFDLRYRFDDFEHCFELLGEEVLGKIR